jgi:Cu(I)/Ag(I) efflux system protein CusF
LLRNNRQIILLATLFLLTFCGASCNKKSSVPAIHEGTGVIEEVNKDEATIQINHEEIKDYMPAMSMPYKVKDKALLEQIKTGDKVAFTVEDSSAGIFVIGLKKAEDKSAAIPAQSNANQSAKPLR